VRVRDSQPGLTSGYRLLIGSHLWTHRSSANFSWPPPLFGSLLFHFIVHLLISSAYLLIKYLALELVSWNSIPNFTDYYYRNSNLNLKRPIKGKIQISLKNYPKNLLMRSWDYCSCVFKRSPVFPDKLLINFLNNFYNTWRLNS